MKKLFIVTGSSGSGISSSRYVFEELGYYIVENVPSYAISKMLDGFAMQEVKAGYCLLVNVSSSLETFKICNSDERFDTKLILLSCDQEEIVHRYTLSRRVHPRTILENISLLDAIKLDKEETEKLDNLCSLKIDTTHLGLKEFRETLYSFIDKKHAGDVTTITFMSFGLKNGIPSGLDTFFDVRVIPNPYWIESLSELNGYDQPVIDYLSSFPITKTVIDNIIAYLDIYIPELQKTKRGNYVIGIACSGGQHRSTYVARALAMHYQERYKVILKHKDSPSLNLRKL